MFEYIPRNRFLPDQCLKHDYFRLHPLPSTSLSLSDTQEIHGFEAMKQSAKEKKTKAYLPPHPSKRRASDYDPQFFKRGRNRYTTKRRRYNYPQEQVKEVQKPMKVLNQKVLPFFTHMEIVPELTKFDRGAGSLTSEYLDPNRLAALGVVNIPQMKSPTIEDNLFF